SPYQRAKSLRQKVFSIESTFLYTKNDTKSYITNCIIAVLVIIWGWFVPLTQELPLSLKLKLTNSKGEE
ncbi:MAG: hypothetical protein MSS16_10990, partial [Streptococcus orisratti]|uniref:hypothetical protein n=1 Tax=Streptococcus orisratti TaxID=114652 RepID=UPI0023573F57